MKIDFKSFAFGIILTITLVYLLYIVVPKCEVYPVISPGSEDEILGLMNSAKSSINLEMYVFTNKNLMNGLINAHERGVNVKVILDPTVDINTDAYHYLVSNGVNVNWACNNYVRTHSKLMIIDEEIVFIGSTNFSNAAVNKNRETAVVIKGCTISEFMALFYDDWACI